MGENFTQCRTRASIYIQLYFINIDDMLIPFLFPLLYKYATQLMQAAPAQRHEIRLLLTPQAKSDAKLHTTT